MAEPLGELPIEEIERIEAPDRNAFERDYLRASRPAVLTGLTRDWLPPEHWTFEGMAARYGSADVIAASLRDGMLDDDSNGGKLFARVRLEDFTASASRPGVASRYVMAPTWNFPATFAGDYRVPGYCEGASYLRAKVWLGKVGTVTPTHRDVPHNLHVHLSGRKRWLLFPSGGAGMYPRGVLSSMPNFSQIDPERPDYDRYPKFRGIKAFAATLAAGETLFIPHGWWHHTRTLDDAVAMNFWWGGSLVYLANLASTTFKRVTGIRRDEWG